MVLNPERLLGASIPTRRKTYEDREPILYALSVGARADELDLVHETRLRVIPSYAQMVGFDDSWLDACGVDLARVVHGSLDIVFHDALKAFGAVDVATRISGLTDKGEGRGGIIHQETRINQSGTLVSTGRSSLFVRGGGGFGGDRGTQPEPTEIPEGEPHLVASVATMVNQAALFRLLGDRNPLHIDPATAQCAKFDGPILHGAATFGVACLTFLRHFCDTDPARLKRFAARFAGPVYPGETLEFSFWQSSDTCLFRATAKERGVPVLDSGLAVQR